MKKTKWTTKSFFKSFKCALNGIKYVFCSQRNILIQTVFAIIAITLGFVFKISLAEWGILSLTIAFVIFAECFNTAVETTVDLVTEDYNEKAKLAKDIAAGSVLISALNSIVVGLIIFAGRIINLFL